MFHVERTMKGMNMCGNESPVIQFWDEFVQLESSLKDLPIRERFDKANAVFQIYFPDLALEMEGSDEYGDVRIIFTAHGVLDRFPQVMAIVAGAPELQHHQVTAFRQRTMHPEKFALKMGNSGFAMSADKILFACMPHEGCVGLLLRFNGDIPFDIQDRARSMAFILLDHILGEYDFAVKTGFVDFNVNEQELESLTWLPLDQLPDHFDRFWRNVSGYTGFLPDSSQSRYCGLRAETEEGELIITLNDSARRVAMRADLTYVVTLRVDTALYGLEMVQDIQDEIDAWLISQRQGLMTFSVLQYPWREGNYYTGDSALAEKFIRQALQRTGIDEFELTSAFDPSWRKYFNYAVHVSLEG